MLVTSPSESTQTLDAVDRRLLLALHRDVRAPNTALARAARISEEVVAYRLARLTERGILRGTIAIYDLGYWSYKVALQFQHIESDEESRLIDQLAALPRVTWVTPCSGVWDCVLVIMAKDPVDFAKTMSAVTALFGAKIRRHAVSVSVGGTTFGHTYLIGAVPPVAPAPRVPRSPLDERDRAILAALQLDARVRLTTISEKTGIPIDSIRYRLQALTRSGVIKRYRVILNTSALGFSRHELFISCTAISDAIMNRFREFARASQKVEYVGRAIGNWDLTMTVYTRSAEELRGFVMELKAQFGTQIQSIDSMLLFTTRSYTYTPDELASETRKEPARKRRAR